MKYFAKLDTTNKVISVYSVHDNEAPTEEAGIIFLSHLYNYSYWKETKKDGSIRKNYAGKGYQYSNDKDAFIPPKINFDSWVLNESTCQWEAPVAHPNDGKRYDWNEETTSWDEIIE